MTLAAIEPHTSRHQSIIEDSWDMLMHDVRNPLATAHVYIQLLRRRAAKAQLQPTELDQGLQNIEDAVERVERLLNPRNGARNGPSCGTDLIELACEMVTQAQHAAGAARRITVLPHTKTVVGSWDRVDLERILSNLLENALKYSPTDGQVLVTIRSDGAVAVLTVADQGFGISAKDLPHVFEPGYRAADTAALAPGRGIGLAAVRNIARRYGGEVSIGSRPSVGTTVTVHLPLKREGHPES